MGEVGEVGVAGGMFCPCFLARIEGLKWLHFGQMYSVGRYDISDQADVTDLMPK